MGESMTRQVRFGLVLPNRGVLIGLSSIPSLFSLTAQAEADPVWDSVWVGDSILAKPRLDALVLLGGLAAMTRRLQLGVACMASTPLRQPLLLAYQWASLDALSGGRTIFVACQGQSGAGGGGFAEEFAAFGIDPASRSLRMEEAIEILRLTTGSEDVSFAGLFTQFDHVTILPRPIQQPVPIWVTANVRPERANLAQRALDRVARLGDGWMSTAVTPEYFADCLATIRRLAVGYDRPLTRAFEACLYYNVIVGDNRSLALEEAKRYLDRYYGTSYEPGFVAGWVAAGTPAECAAQLRSFILAGATTITLRLTGFDEALQFRRVTEEVLPALSEYRARPAP